jgi:hypothetical protein
MQTFTHGLTFYRSNFNTTGGKISGRRFLPPMARETEGLKRQKPWVQAHGSLSWTGTGS